MKKISISIFLVLTSFSICLSQKQNDEIEFSDWSKFEEIKNVYSSNPERLSSLITSKYDSELDKIQAIYYWVTNNITYDYKQLEKLASKGPDRNRYTLEEIKEMEKKQTLAALKKKKGICQQYAWLFKDLCNYSGIECEFVGGVCKSDPTRSAVDRQSHAWNAVKYNDEWYWVDATWGSMRREDKKRDARTFYPGYFFTDKEIFSYNHFANDEKWQLTNETIEKETFKSYPFVSRGSIEFGVKELKPFTREVEFKKGKDFDISFELSQKPDREFVCFNIKSQKRADVEFIEDGNKFTAKVNTSKLSSGYYAFWADGEVLFIYKFKGI